MNKTYKNILFCLVAILPFLYVCVIWVDIPDIVPMHFDGNMHVNRYGSKYELLGAVSLLSGISIGMYFLLRYLPAIDPKRKGQPMSKGFDKLSVAILIFLTAINMMVTIASTKNADVIKYALMPMVGLLFAFLGNYMYSIKPNYFAGIRTPWTLNDDENWRKTHKLGGIMFFAWGVIFTIVSLLLPLAIVHKLLVGSAIAMVVILYAYSFILFKNSDKTKENTSNH